MSKAAAFSGAKLKRVVNWHKFYIEFCRLISKNDGTGPCRNENLLGTDCPINPEA